MKKDLTKGPVTKTMLYFAAPMILGNLLQQGYNIVDTLIVGRFLGADALAAVGSAYSLMTFLNAIMIGLCMGSGTIFSVCFGKQDKQQLKNYVAVSFLWIAAVTILLNIVSLLGVDGILHALKVPSALYGMMRDYVWVIFLESFLLFYTTTLHFCCVHWEILWYRFAFWERQQVAISYWISYLL